jgi:hypothetical protein
MDGGAEDVKGLVFWELSVLSRGQGETTAMAVKPLHF